MNKELIKKAFREWKKATKADYAVTYPDSLGDCQTCVNDALATKYGMESKGIFLKHWHHGMNADVPIEKCDSVYIAHDITEEQASEIVRIFGKYFHVFPERYEPWKCFELLDKNKPLYEVRYAQIWDDEWRVYTDNYTDLAKAHRRKNWLMEHGFAPQINMIRKAVSV